MSSNYESGPVCNQGTHAPSVLFMCEHMLRCRKMGRCEKGGGGKSCYTVGWMSWAPKARLGSTQCEPAAPTEPLVKTFCVGRPMQSLSF